MKYSIKVVNGDYIIKDSIVDGVGLRNVLFTQGCKHNCKGCHNPGTHPFNLGKDIGIDKIIEELTKDTLATGITISGGDPMYQPEAVYELVKRLKGMGYNIWIYTGFGIKELDNVQKRVLEFIDVLVDGRFIEQEKSMEIKYKGSANQRLIDVPLYIKTGKIKEIDV